MDKLWAGYSIPLFKFVNFTLQIFLSFIWVEVFSKICCEMIILCYTRSLWLKRFDWKWIIKMIRTRLIFERKSINIAVQDIADIVGVGVATVYRWECLGTSPYNQERYKIALAKIKSLKKNNRKKANSSNKKKPRKTTNSKNKDNNNKKTVQSSLWFAR